MGWTEVGKYSKVVKCPLENQYFASYIAIAAIYFERICMYVFVFPECRKGTCQQNLYEIQKILRTRLYKILKCFLYISRVHVTYDQKFVHPYTLLSLPSSEYDLLNKRIWNKISKSIKQILGKIYEYVGKKIVISKRIYPFIRYLRVHHL